MLMNKIYTPTFFIHVFHIHRQKHKNKIFYFDPQNKTDVPDNRILSKTLAHIVKYTGNTFISRFGYYSVSGLDDPIQMINVRCPIKYVG
jgi:hypothetical protein